MRVEIRNNSIIIDGYVNAVARDSRLIPDVKGSFREQIVPKAFQRALEKAENVDILLNHDKNRKLGSTTEGNLELFEDNIGLRAIATITDAEVIEKAKRNELRGWSFGFYSVKDRWEDIEEGVQRRYVEDLELTEVSIVDNTKVPAYSATSIETRANEEVLTETRALDSVVKIADNTNKVDNSKYKEEIKSLKRK
ncbi:HK97 family phage prohead protease [Clostridium perfringens]|jgi:HK97 family phage prohead protease|uniref:HK97 family phage prohead protease n=1 Tax=Clostridium perfringens TaxID=1502 RepID=UPI000D8A74F2|nr:HK97 family phage prohead protease [Clostridium perfringens]DAL45203.1 MAG TPA_asm: head maturation protease [Caudoviricetes sp.]EHK2362491.1 HK97 family phage prohead protease [Clostridium perfringens]MDK0576483.1 HK97 family phage prohead protease [Clostridium perfringens]MDK0579426.1 HK97 family phage prohead protease [Clostridium perfringens]MDM0470838.1 HK97 family phage prohead protease [Clostridium perfringens]